MRRQYWAIIFAIIFMVIWFISLILTTVSLDKVIASSSIPSAPSNDDSRSYQQKQNDDIAIDIPGVELQLSPPNNNDDDVPIQVIYTNYTTNYSEPSKSKGIVLLLHACSHSALKFFTSSPNCKSCIGLSEELRIARLVIQYGYIPIAISSINRNNGCWSNKDIPRIQRVLNYWSEQYQYHQQKVKHPVYAIGASSGGSFASQLLVNNIVDGALVMVMSLSNNVVQRLKEEPFKPLYLAPMPRDTNTLTRCEQNYHDLISTSSAANSNRIKEYIRLDKTTCKSIPVTVPYLIQRIPHMTMNHANHLIYLLKQANHIDEITNMLLVDPTKSNWRDIILPNKNGGTNNKSTYWLDLYDLTPGYSQVAKSLHRAWAYHEYCSEVVLPALRFFEEHSMQ